jgi:hypothetical protein
MRRKPLTTAIESGIRAFRTGLILPTLSYVEVRTKGVGTTQLQLAAERVHAGGALGVTCRRKNQGSRTHGQGARHGDDYACARDWPPQSRLGYATTRSPDPGVLNCLTGLSTPSLLPLLSIEVTL